MSKIILLCCDANEHDDIWFKTLQKRLQAHHVLHQYESVLYDVKKPLDIEPLDDIEFVALNAAPPQGLLAGLTKLRAMISLWAGVDHIVCEPDFPVHIPLYRMVEDGLVQGMIQYCIGHVMHYHLLSDIHQKLQKDKIWETISPPLISDRKVGIMGLGVLGLAVGEALQKLGFKIYGWSRSAKTHPAIQCFEGQNNLALFLSHCEILILLLPKSKQTKHIINAHTLNLMPKDSAIINAGRGHLIDEKALIHALQNKHIRGATLDVFDHEPLPKDHAFWDIDQLRITPHIASITRPKTGVERIIEVMDHTLQNKALSQCYNHTLGY
ncbi:MAG: glyoxylate/hydroxypyruvate reductase A [Pseudomonadota bacterium]